MQLYDLYIPLCFYYIETDMEVIKSFAYFTFHYASTISGNAKVYGNAEVYFTFHYASTISRRWHSESNSAFLYIPLCFYYIKGGVATVTAMAYFTFHYASTISWLDYGKLRGIGQLYIPLCFYYITTSKNAISVHLFFTFHYASTISPAMLAFGATILTLHSTMLLLYPGCENKLL